MTHWEILKDGSPWSHHYTDIRSPKRAADVVAEWRNERRGPQPEGEYSARLYGTSALDSYGVKRGG